jgi:hypothetical protein
MKLNIGTMAGVVALVAWLLWPSGSVVSINADTGGQKMSSDEEFAADYVQSLQELAKKHGMSMEDVRRKAMLVHLGEAAYPPGSKVISENLHVVDGANNALVLSGKKWTGRSSRQAEFVIVHDGRVLASGSVGTQDARQGTTVILFSPNRIDYLDWTTLRGGSFRR